jgi:hypothetical protein
VWQAKREQDYARIYDYLSPAYREKTSRDEFLKLRPKFLYLSTKLEWVQVTDDQARARVKFTAKFNERAMSKMVPMERAVIDTWIRSDGQWYLELGAGPAG